MLILGLALAGLLVVVLIAGGDGGAPITTGGTIAFVSPFRYDAPGDDARNLNAEVVTIQNRGTTAADFTGWMLRSDTARFYEFPRGFTLAPGAKVTIHSGCGRDSRTNLYWCASGPVWDDNEGEATLYDRSGTKVAVYSYKRF
jgi:hypothetical protein